MYYLREVRCGANVNVGDLITVEDLIAG